MMAGPTIATIELDLLVSNVFHDTLHTLSNLSTKLVHCVHALGLRVHCKFLPEAKTCPQHSYALGARRGTWKLAYRPARLSRDKFLGGKMGAAHIILNILDWTHQAIVTNPEPWTLTPTPQCPNLARSILPLG